MDASIYCMRLRDVLTICVLALLSLGLVMVQSASSSLSGAIVRARSVDPNAVVRESGPARPVNVVAAASNDGIELSWSPDRDQSVVAYRVYRSPRVQPSESPAAEKLAARDPFELLDTLRKPHTRYKDAAAPVGEASTYRVTALDDTGAESPPAELISTRPGLWRWTNLGSKHLMYVLLAITVYFIVSRLNYAKLAPQGEPLFYAPVLWLLAIATLACAAVLVPGVGTAVNGARRWIKLGPVQLQPSELAKWSTVLFLSYWMTRPSVRLDRFFTGLVPTLIPIAALCLLVVIQDFGTAVLIGLCALTMLLAGRIKWWHLAILIVPAMIAAYWFVAHKEYRLRRVMAFRDPYASPQGEGYHMIQSLLSFSSGGVLGRGLGNGVQKLGYLPEDTTDFVFAIICEELGLFGAMLTVALYLGIIFVVWQTVKQKRDDFGRMLAFGVAAMIGLQAAINIAVATVSVPTKGLSLPLVSAGGSGLIITCAALGLLCSVTRNREKRARHAMPEPLQETADVANYRMPATLAAA